ncbi:MAG: hypothetical protein RBU30_17065 [Polyangia bacterium]|nr:hypothetical protein [Polyangia bacterium]
MPSPLHSCSSEPRPLVTALDVKEAPVRISLVRAQHLCLGEYAALFRLEGASPGLVTQIVIEREWSSVHGDHEVRREVESLAWTFEKGTVRYLRIRWREGLENRGERVLRLRLLRAHLAEGPSFEAGPATAPAPPGGGHQESLGDKLHQVGEKIRQITDKIRKAHEKMEQNPLARHPPPAARPEQTR